MIPKDTARQNKPTMILTGFLGAGKTTFLNHLLNSNPDIRYAIIENEYGEQSIDSELIIRGEDEIVELNNGCLCCTLNDNLYEILNTLFDRRDEYDQIIIEATGVANPVGLAEPFIIHPLIKKQFPLTSIICLVDAELIEKQLVETEEAISQITFSDVLLINKTDLVSPEVLTPLRDRLQQLNPLAKIVFGNKNEFPAIEPGTHNPLFDEPHFKSTPGKDLQIKNDHFPVSKPESDHHHHHTKAVISHTFVFDRPFKYDSLYHRILVYLALQSEGLYRMKGVIWLMGSEEKHIIQSVGKRLNIEAKEEWGSQEKRLSKIVFIGKNLPVEGLEKLLKRCTADLV